MSPPVPVCFIRHRFEGVTAAILQPFFEQGRFVLRYQDIESCNPDDYDDKPASDAIRRMNEFRARGGLMVADYSELMNGKMLIGRVERGTPVEYERVPDLAGEHVYKTIQMKQVRQISVMHYPVLLSIRPRQGGIMISWDKYRSLVEAAYESKALPAHVRSLSDGQLEVLCFEYLRDTGELAYLLMPIGRTLADVDVLGVNSQGARVAAQVTFATDSQELEHKALALAQYASELASGVFFSPNTPPEQFPGNVRWVGIDHVFEYFNQKSHPLLTAMLNPTLSSPALRAPAGRGAHASRSASDSKS